MAGPTMQKVSTLVSKDIGNYLVNSQTWNGVMYNVLQEGLVGDGTTDDTAALQTLINTAIAAGRKAIFFPHTASGGEYFVTALTNESQVEFFGDNASFVGGYTHVIKQLGDWPSIKQLDQPFVGRLKTVKQDTEYNTWPVIVRTTTNRLIVFYGRGEVHALRVALGRALCYKYSDSDGLLWSEEIVMFQDPLFDFTTFSAVALADGSVLCIVDKYTVTTTEYLVMKSTDNGLTFTEVFDFSDSSEESIRAPGYPNVPIEMDNGEIIASKQSLISGLFGLFFIFSADGGETWNKSVEAVAPTHASVVTMPWEVRLCHIGGGKLVAIGRNNQGNPYQLTSDDYGLTWTVATTNIDDCLSHNLFPLYRAGNDSISLYYTDRDSNTILKRTAPATFIYNSPSSWPNSEILDYTSSESTAIDSGYPTAITLRNGSRDAVVCFYTTRGEAATDDISPRKTAIVTIYDKIDNADIYSPTNGLYRAALINGGFDYWIRGTSFTATGYTADRWRQVVGTGSTVTTTREAFTAGQLVVPSEPVYNLKLDISVVGSGTTFLVQRIEDVRSFAGQIIFYTFYAKCSTDTYLMNVLATQNFGSGGSSSVSSAQTTHTISPTFRKYTGQLTIPSISGQTIGTESYLEFVFRFPTASGVNAIQLSQVQLNAGEDSFFFNKRHIAEELMLCERYALAYVGASNNPIGNGMALSTTQARIQVHFPVTMRELPTLTATATEWQLSDGVTATDLTTISIITAQGSDKTLTLLCTVAAGLTQFRPYQLIADGTVGRTMIFDAEL